METFIELMNALDDVIRDLLLARRLLVAEMLKSDEGSEDIRKAAVRVSLLITDIEKSAKRFALEEHAASKIVEAIYKYVSLDISRASLLEALRKYNHETTDPNR